MSYIVIVDYGMGNFYSVMRAVQIAEPKVKVKISRRAEDILTADRIIFPGQGAISDCMLNLDKFGLRESIMEAVLTKPIMGICVGEQMLFEKSEENNTSGLALFEGSVQKFRGLQFASANNQSKSMEKSYSKKLIKVPHIGWNKVNYKDSHELWKDIPDGSYFYFVHSYYAVPENQSDIFGQTFYGINFSSAVARSNIFAVQFHPEKSAKMGLLLYKNFLSWNP